MTTGREPRRNRRVLHENAALRAENLALREHCRSNARLRQQAAEHKAQLDEILGSRAWAFVQKARRAVSLLRDALRFLPVRSTAIREDEPSGGLPAPSWASNADSPRPYGGGNASRGRLQHQGSLKVSVIVPNYNHAPFLAERLRSIFAQTYRPHEIVFLDDASSDESVAIARRLASESPLPFRLVLNDSNSGSTFRQWLKGIDLARGDLVWIAESDDTCRPELLERLVPEFLDPEVMLAYCQSATIGPDGRRLAQDYLSSTEDLSPVRWRHRYRVAGREEVELALSQRNTIPNASAVVFRKPDVLDEREDLTTLALAGDWLFYAMRIRRGKIAYVPEPLNGHRHHHRTVRHAFERAIELFEEQLRVKARIFESFPVSATAMLGSMAGGFAEYAQRMEGLGSLPAMTEHPRLTPHLDRLRAVFRERTAGRPEPRILFVVSGVTVEDEPLAAIQRANEQARRFPVFLCNALPGVLDPSVAATIDRRIILLEGTLGLRPWSADGDPHPDPRASAAMSPRRGAIVRELIRFHQIGAIHSQGRWADWLLTVAGVSHRATMLPEVPDSDAEESFRRRRRATTRLRGRGASIGQTGR
jgi:glycosyltransferase involved in cell wall biosynthesis